MFGAVAQFEDDSLGGAALLCPDVGDAAGDGDLLATAVTGSRGHTLPTGESRIGVCEDGGSAAPAHTEEAF